jgi:hypothetical protein
MTVGTQQTTHKTVTKPLERLLQELSAIKNGDFTEFQTWLKENNCTALDLCRKATGISLANLFTALEGSDVVSLDLSCNDITAAGAAEIAKLLPNSKLTTLDLSFCDLKKVIKDLAEALLDSNLKTLNLANSSLDDESAKILVQYLPQSKLHELILWADCELFDDNDFSDENKEIIIDAIKHSHLLKVELECDEPLQTKLQQALRHNQWRLLTPPATLLSLRFFEEEINKINEQDIKEEDKNIFHIGKFFAKTGVRGEQNVKRHILSFLPYMESRQTPPMRDGSEVVNRYCEQLKELAPIMLERKRLAESEAPLKRKHESEDGGTPSKKAKVTPPENKANPENGSPGCKIF